MNWEGKGLKILNKNLTNLRFEDDIFLVAMEMVTKGEDIKYHSEKYGLTMNMEKIKFLSNRKGISEFFFCEVGPKWDTRTEARWPIAPYLSFKFIGGYYKWN